MAGWKVGGGARLLRSVREEVGAVGFGWEAGFISLISVIFTIYDDIL
ncbi:MAG: hypothetical protein V8S26_10460 [Lachnospiraceae bacterium]